MNAISRPLGRFGTTSALLFVLLMAALSARAQRHVQHLNALTFQYGRSAYGSVYRGGYSRYTSDRTRFEIVALREAGHRDHPVLGAGAPYYGYDLGLGLAPQLFRLGEVAYVHGLFQLHARYDRLHRAAEVESVPDNPDVAQGVSAGPTVGASLDLYLADAVSLSGQATLGYLALHPTLTHWPRYAGVGLTFHFR